MSKRISTLTRYLFGRQFRSVSGILFLLSGLVVWLIFFSPTSGRVPELSVMTLIIGVYGFFLSFLLTLSIAAKVYRGASAPFFTRLPSRIEFLTATMLTAVLSALLIQAILALVILVQPGGAQFSAAKLLEIPPLWIALNIFASVFAFHATDLVQSGWSRVWIFGILAVLLFSQSIDVRTMRWLSNQFNIWSTSASRQGWDQLSTWLRSAAAWAGESGLDFTSALGIVFWPFRAISQGVQAGNFDNSQALAPAILMLYATIFFLLAADFLANKDLHLLD